MNSLINYNIFHPLFFLWIFSLDAVQKINLKKMKDCIEKNIKFQNK